MSKEYVSGMVVGPVTAAENAQAEVERLKGILAHVSLATNADLNSADPKKVLAEVHKFVEKAL